MREREGERKEGSLDEVVKIEKRGAIFVAREVLRGAQERVSERDGVTLVPTLALAGASGVCMGLGGVRGVPCPGFDRGRGSTGSAWVWKGQESCPGYRAEVLRGSTGSAG